MDFNTMSLNDIEIQRAVNKLRFDPGKMQSHEISRAIAKINEIYDLYDAKSVVKIEVELLKDTEDLLFEDCESRLRTLGQEGYELLINAMENETNQLNQYKLAVIVYRLGTDLELELPEDALNKVCDKFIEELKTGKPHEKQVAKEMLKKMGTFPLDKILNALRERDIEIYDIREIIEYSGNQAIEPLMNVLRKTAEQMQETHFLRVAEILQEIAKKKEPGFDDLKFPEQKRAIGLEKEKYEEFFEILSTVLEKSNKMETKSRVLRIFRKVGKEKPLTKRALDVIAEILVGEDKQLKAKLIPYISRFHELKDHPLVGEAIKSLDGKINLYGNWDISKKCKYILENFDNPIVVQWGWDLFSHCVSEQDKKTILRGLAKKREVINKIKFGLTIETTEEELRSVLNELNELTVIPREITNEEVKVALERYMELAKQRTQGEKDSAIGLYKEILDRLNQRIEFKVKIPTNIQRPKRAPGKRPGKGVFRITAKG